LAGQTLTLNERQWADLRSQLVRYVRVGDGQYEYEFRCETPVELWRARTLVTKEAGTVDWIAGQVRPGDVFYDIGANIGLYTLLAGKRVSSEGQVYAFEPHVKNVDSLLQNVSRNALTTRVKVLSCALHDSEGFFDFNYYQSDAGSSMSQLDGNRDACDQTFVPAFAEYKYATTIDRLVETGAIRPADHVKLDVDGNELMILHGMQQLLAGPRPPRSVQVEINARHKQALFAFMQCVGYAQTLRHDTLLGKQALASGRDPESIGYNAVFQKRAA
jgi:FkbM family methyltransferase